MNNEMALSQAYANRNKHLLEEENHEQSESEEYETDGDGAELKTMLPDYAIYNNRHKKMPSKLAHLVKTVTAIRKGPPSPKSVWVSKLSARTSHMTELDAMVTLENYLGFEPDDGHGGGESNVYRSHDRLWTVESIPEVESLLEEETTDQLDEWAAQDTFPRPKPDITYGYVSETFTKRELKRMTSVAWCADPISGTQLKPVLPFLVFEWKSASGDLNNCKLQATRDGAAAVNAMLQFLHQTGAEGIGVESSAAFCVCVNSETLEILISWHCEDSKAGHSWETDTIHKAFLSEAKQVFHARSILLNILAWARGPRLQQIKAALQPSKKRLKSEENEAGRKRRKR